ncbi:MAG: hypothetical protein Q4B47_02600 [Eubacteriales bacterium]|nr:hypothetical protein [Eubacteriales bacterium]
MKKRVLAMLLSTAMVVTSLPINSVSVFASEDTDYETEEGSEFDEQDPDETDYEESDTDDDSDSGDYDDTDSDSDDDWSDSDDSDDDSGDDSDDDSNEHQQFDLSEAVELIPGEKYSAEWEANGYASYYFTPTEETAGKYKIYSVADDVDTYVELYEIDENGLSTGAALDENDDGAGNGQFSLSYELNAGTTYLYKVRTYDNTEGSCEVIFMVDNEDSSDDDSDDSKQFDLSKAVELIPGESYFAEWETDEYASYYFTPTEVTEGKYKIYSVSEGVDTFVELYEIDENGLSSGAVLAADDESAGNGQFSLSYELNAGTTYLYKVQSYNHFQGSCEVFFISDDGEQFDLSEAVELTPGESCSTKFDEDGYAYFTFKTSEETAGSYTLFSSYNGNNSYMNVQLFELSDNGFLSDEIASDMGGAGNGQFSLCYSLSANITYVYKVKEYYDGSDRCNVRFIKDKEINKLEAVDLTPGHTYNAS